MEEHLRLKNFKIGTIGYNHSHPKDFFLEYPEGLGCYLFLLIKTPGLFQINGKHFEAKPNSFLIISPSTKIIYKAKNQTYTDDWCYCNMSDEDAQTIKKMGIEFNVIHYLEESDEISSIIHFLTFEHYSADLYHEEMEENYANILFLKLSRIIKSNLHQSADIFATKNEKLTFLRSKIFSDPSFFEDVNAMAEFMNISRSGFQHHYKNTFGTNVMADVINSRIEYSKRLLTSTKLSIAEIAAKTNYKSEYAFMRQFKDRTGMTPTEYRRGDNWLHNHHEKE